MTFDELVDLFYDALQPFVTEEEAYEEVGYIGDEAQKLGFTLLQVAEAYEQAERL